jgi:hypothetical protein
VLSSIWLSLVSRSNAALDARKPSPTREPAQNLLLRSPVPLRESMYFRVRDHNFFAWGIQGLWYVVTTCSTSRNLLVSSGLLAGSQEVKSASATREASRHFLDVLSVSR